MSNLRLQYRTSLSEVVTAITTRRFTPDIFPVSSLRKSLNINNTLFEHDILTAYSLGRIHHNIYRFNESLVFLVMFPTPLPKLFRLNRPFILPKKIAEKRWRLKSFPDDVRLINYNNQWHTTPIGGWTKEDGLVILEIEHLQTPNISGNTIDVDETFNEYQSINTLYGAWTVCEFNFSLYKWKTDYKCLNKNYLTMDSLTEISLLSEMKSIKLLSHNRYTKSAKNSAIRELVENQEEEIANHSKIVEEYMNRLKSLVELTKEGTNLFSEVANNILNLLPGNWGSTIKRILLIIALIITVPIIFFMFALTCKIFKLMCWCYKPVISGINHGINNMGALVTSSALGLRDIARRVPYWRFRETSRVETSVVRYD